MATPMLPGLGGGTGGAQIQPGQLANAGTAPMSSQNVAASQASGSVAVTPGNLATPTMVKSVNPTADNTVQQVGPTATTQAPPVPAPAAVPQNNNVPGTSMPVSSTSPIQTPQNLPQPQVSQPPALQMGQNGALPPGLNPFAPQSQNYSQYGFPGNPNNTSLSAFDAFNAQQPNVNGGTGPTGSTSVDTLKQNLAQATGTNGTQGATADKYNQAFNANKNKAAPTSQGDATQTIQGATGANSGAANAVVSSYATSLAPIMAQFSQILSNINNPTITGQTLQSQYDQLASQNNLPAMKTEMVNMQNIMNGTIEDVRNEVTKSGGFASESQVQGIAAARNKTMLLQYNALANNYQAAMGNVQNMMQYAASDRSAQLQAEQLQASVTSSMANVQTQMMQMAMTMNQQAREAIEFTVGQTGYTGLAQSAQGDKQILNSYENLLGLAPGALSDPTALAGMDTYKNQQLQINNYRAAIAAYSAGYGGYAPGNTPSSTPPPGYSAPGQVGVTPTDPTTLTRPSSVANGVPLTMSAAQMEQYMSVQKSAAIDPGTHNIVAPGVGYYLQQSDGSYVLKSALPSPVAQQYNDIRQTIDNTQPASLSPTVTRKWSLVTNSGIKSFQGLGTYQVISQIAPYLANIRAASENPSSVSDLELLDSYVRASKGGTGQITDTQVDTILKGSNIADNWQQLQNKLTTGGVLSPQQRQDIQTLAQNVYAENQSDYQKIYIQAIQNLQNQGVPVQFWGQMPDLSSLMTQ